MPRLNRGGVAFGAALLMFVAFLIFGGRLMGGDESHSGAPPSVPSTSVFDRQSESYKVQVLPRNVPRIAIEAGVTDLWWKYGVAAVVGLDRFGESVVPI